MIERTNEEQLELFADLLEPASEILADKELAAMLSKGEKPILAVKMAIKNHKSAIIEILARLDGVEPADYKVNLIALPIKLLGLLNSPMVQELFSAQDQSETAASSGAATENTEADAS